MYQKKRIEGIFTRLEIYIVELERDSGDFTEHADTPRRLTNTETIHGGLGGGIRRAATAY